jgi:hypothetical protein
MDGPDLIRDFDTERLKLLVACVLSPKWTVMKVVLGVHGCALCEQVFGCSATF